MDFNVPKYDFLNEVKSEQQFQIRPIFLWLASVLEFSLNPAFSEYSKVVISLRNFESGIFSC